MQQDAEIAHLMWDFMEDDRDGRRNPYRQTCDITRSDDQSIDQIVDHITDHIHDGERMDMRLGDRHMAVISMDDLLRDQTKKDSS